jgi:hypothetical protein
VELISPAAKIAACHSGIGVQLIRLTLAREKEREKEREGKRERERERERERGTAKTLRLFFTIEGQMLKVILVRQNIQNCSSWELDWYTIFFDDLVYIPLEASLNYNKSTNCN